MITHIHGKLLEKTPTYVVVDVNGIDTWLEQDQLSGFVKVRGLSEIGKSSSTTGEFIGSGDFIPRTDEVKLFCEKCK